MSLADLLTALQAHPSTPDLTNPYTLTDANQARRSANLMRYWREVEARTPQVLLLMEAPGYRGCRLTGVPVTSRKILREGVADLGVFGAGYEATDDAGFEDIDGEQSATIVWGELAQLHLLPIIWNACPFHPHEAGKPRTNRAPRPAELRACLPYTQAILAHFRPQRVLAVGNVASGVLTQLQVTHHKIRHPAQGGKHDFVRGLREFGV